MWSVWAASRTRSWLRASPRTRTSSGMMLVARPPSMRPMFAVVSASMRPSRMLAIASAATRIALTPRSGAMPACAALPRTTTSRWLAPGARVKARPTASLSKTRPRRARTRERSRCFAPRRPTSSQMVNTTSSGGWRRPRSRHTRTHSQTRATPDLSSPPRTVVPSVRMTSSSTIGLTPSPGATVSMCAQRRSAGASVVPGRCAIRLPVSPPSAAPASSKLTSAPRASSSRASRAAIRPSRREWLSIRTSSRKRDLRRAGSITSGGHYHGDPLVARRAGTYRHARGGCGRDPDRGRGSARLGGGRAAGRGRVAGDAPRPPGAHGGDRRERARDRRSLRHAPHPRPRLRDGPRPAVFMTVKAYDTAAMAAAVAPHLARDGFLLSLQNGLGNVEAAERALGAARVLGARVIFGSELVAPGHARVTVYADPVLIGSPDPTDARRQDAAARWAAELSAAGIPAKLTGALTAELWAKVPYNAALNPLGALLGVPYGDLPVDRDTRMIMDAVIEEAFAVARAEGVELAWPDASGYRAVFYGRLVPSTAAHRSSMLQDIERRRPTEIDAINGEVAARGAAHGVPTPVNATLARLIRARTRVGRPREDTRWSA